MPTPPLALECDSEDRVNVRAEGDTELVLKLGDTELAGIALAALGAGTVAGLSADAGSITVDTTEDDPLEKGFPVVALLPRDGEAEPAPGEGAATASDAPPEPEPEALAERFPFFFLPNTFTGNVRAE